MKISGNGTKCEAGSDTLGSLFDIDIKYDKSKGIISGEALGEKAEYKVDIEEDRITLTELSDGKVEEDANVYIKELKGSNGNEGDADQKGSDEADNSESFQDLTFKVPDGFERTDEGDDENMMTFREESEGNYPGTLMLNYVESSEVVDFSDKDSVDNFISSWIDGETFSDERNREELEEDGNTNFITDCTANVEGDKIDACSIFINDTYGNVYVITVVSETESPREIAEKFYENLSYDFG